MTTEVDSLVDRYLHDLDAELRDLPATPWLEIVALVALVIPFLLPIVAAVYLAIRLRGQLGGRSAAR
jgi:uncharacterized membrane protein YphA (DoxX/SURF4 family)